jgi:hypothetical protein
MAQPNEIVTQLLIPQGPTQPAFKKHEAAIRSITPDNTREARLDLNAACSRAFAVTPYLKALRPRIEQTFRDFDFVTYDSLEERIYAAHHCNALWRAKVTNKEDVGDLAESVGPWLRKLSSAYDMLIEFGVASEEPKGRMGQIKGYGGLMNDLTTVLGVLRGVDAKYIARTMLEPGDLDLAENALLSFQSAWGRREVINPGRDELAVLRAQSFTYMYDGYDLARRVVILFEGEDAVEELVPSLFINPAKGKRDAKDEDAKPPSASDNSAATTTTPSSSSGTFAVTNPEGFPEGHPFETKAK